jgi:hypothetical protein
MPDEPFDRLLDSALSSYAEPGPDSGLERRVLVQIAEGSRTQPRSVRLWALALATAVPLLLLVAPAIHTRSNRHIARTDRASQSLPHALPATAPSMAVSPARPHLLPRAAHRESLPKQDVFPTPFPITPEEQALATVALRAPAPELHALAEAQQKDDESSCIAANRYQPHNPPAQGGN